MSTELETETDETEQQSIDTGLAFLMGFTGFSWVFCGAFLTPEAAVAAVALTLVTGAVAFQSTNLTVTRTEAAVEQAD